jgi:hypothetical protein
MEFPAAEPNGYALGDTRMLDVDSRIHLSDVGLTVSAVGFGSPRWDQSPIARGQDLETLASKNE